MSDHESTRISANLYLKVSAPMVLFRSTAMSMHTPVVVVILDICLVYSALIIHDSSQSKRPGSISNPDAITHPSPLADIHIMTWSVFYFTPSIPCTISLLIQGYSYVSTALLWHMLYSSVFVWLTPKCWELQNGPRGLMFGLSSYWNSTATSFLTPPSYVCLLLHKPISMLGGHLPGLLFFVCSTFKEAQRSSHKQDLSFKPLTSGEKCSTCGADRAGRLLILINLGNKRSFSHEEPRQVVGCQMRTH